MTDKTLENKTILVVDDEEFLRDSLRRNLVMKGTSIITAENGQDGLTKYNDNKEIDLVISDMEMPYRDGAWLGTQLRSVGYQNPIIFMSGNPNTFERLGEEIKPYSTFSKPFNLNDLIEFIKEL